MLRHYCILLALFLQLVNGEGSTLGPRDTDVTDVYPDAPPEANFIRRAYHSSAVIGATLIVDGGELTQSITSSGNQSVVQRPMNNTLAVDLTNSWNASTVPWTVVNKNGSVPLNNQKLWTSDDNNTCFAFGGESNAAWFNAGKAFKPPQVDLYQFDLAQIHSNPWTDAESGNGQNGNHFSVFNTLTRPTNALGATLGTTGFIVGGVEDYASDPQSQLKFGDESVPIPGIASYNMSSGEWSNDTTPTNVSNTFLNSVPSFGPSGLLLSSGSSGKNGESRSLDNLTIYEPKSKTWYLQNATGETGEVPPVRKLPCSVGVQGDNGTFEIFLYGGAYVWDEGAANSTRQEIANAIALGQVWVLSLPAFVWFKDSTVPSSTRYRHTCELIGKRQMLTIGGFDPNYFSNGGLQPKDPAIQGLQFYDMTEMVWTQGYDVGAAPYTTPQVVKDWYAKNSLPRLSDPAVAAFFNISGKTPPSASSSASPNATHSSNTRGIAGGVVGGLAALTLGIGLVWLFLRRRRRGEGEPVYSESEQPLGIDDEPLNHKDEIKSELAEPGRLHELQGRRESIKLHEMDGWRPQEVDATKLAN